MSAPEALLDSNIVIAIVAGAHEHHAAFLALLTSDRSARFAVAAHSYAEAYPTLTHRGEHALFDGPPRRRGRRWRASRRSPA